jgi:hypothetical protein
MMVWAAGACAITYLAPPPFRELKALAIGDTQVIGADLAVVGFRAGSHEFVCLAHGFAGGGVFSTYGKQRGANGREYHKRADGSFAMFYERMEICNADTGESEEMSASQSSVLKDVICTGGKNSWSDAEAVRKSGSKLTLDDLAGGWTRRRMRWLPQMLNWKNTSSEATASERSYIRGMQDTDGTLASCSSPEPSVIRMERDLDGSNFLVSPNGRLVAIASERCFEIVDSLTGARLGTIMRFNHFHKPCQFSADSKLLLDSQGYVWAMPSGSLQLPGRGHGASFTSAGSVAMLVCGSTRSQLAFYDIINGKEMSSVRLPVSDERQVYAGTPDRRIICVDGFTYDLQPTWIDEWLKRVPGLKYEPERVRHKCLLIDGDTRQVIFRTCDRVRAISDDGTRVVSDDLCGKRRRVWMLGARDNWNRISWGVALWTAAVVAFCGTWRFGLWKKRF